MQQESLSSYEVTLPPLWGTTKINFYEDEEEEEVGLPFLPGARRRVKKTPKKRAEVAPPPTKVIFGKEQPRILKGQHMEITLGRILCNLQVKAGCTNENSVVSLIELRYQNSCRFGQTTPTVMMTDFHGIPCGGRSFNEISAVVLKDQQVPVWFPSPARLLAAGEETTGWVVFDHLARDCNDINIGGGTTVTPRHLALALALYETSGQTAGRMKGEEIFEFNFR